MRPTIRVADSLSWMASPVRQVYADFEQSQHASTVLLVNRAILAANIVYAVTRRSDRARPGFLFGALATMVTVLGGQLLTALIAGEHPAFFEEEGEWQLLAALGAWAAAAILGKVWRRLTFNVVITLPMLLLEAILTSRTVVDGVREAWVRFPSTTVVPVLFATLSAVGGAILLPALINARAKRFLLPSELSHPSLLTLIALLSSSLFMAIEQDGLLTRQSRLLLAGREVRAAFFVRFVYTLLALRLWVTLFLLPRLQRLRSRLVVTVGKRAQRAHEVSTMLALSPLADGETDVEEEEEAENLDTLKKTAAHDDDEHSTEDADGEMEYVVEEYDSSPLTGQPPRKTEMEKQPAVAQGQGDVPLLQEKDMQAAMAKPRYSADRVSSTGSPLTASPHAAPPSQMTMTAPTPVQSPTSPAGPAAVAKRRGSKRAGARK